MFFVRKDLILHGKKNTSTVYQINNRETILHRNLLHPEIFLTSNGEPSTRLYSLIVGKYHTLPSTYIPKAGYCTTCRTTSILLIHTPSCKCPDLYKAFTRIAEIFNSFTRSQLFFLSLLFNSFLTASQLHFFKS